MALEDLTPEQLEEVRKTVQHFKELGIKFDECEGERGHSYVDVLGSNPRDLSVLQQCTYCHHFERRGATAEERKAYDKMMRTLIH